MISARAWRVEAARLAALAGAGTVGGAILGETGWGLAAGLGAALAWHLWQLASFARSLRDPPVHEARSPAGAWRALKDEAGHLRARSRKRKRRLSRFFKRFRGVAGALPDAVVLLDRAGVLEWCNPAAHDMLGLAWPQVGGRRLAELVSDPLLRDLLEADEASRVTEIPSPVNETRVLALRVTRFGRKRQRMLIARDVTEARRVDSVRRDFVANASHELRTPLTVITGFLETLADTPSPDPDTARAIELMQEHARRMDELIDSLIELSRLEMSDEVRDRAPVPVAEVLEAICESARALSAERCHRVELSADPDLPVFGSRSGLQSAFANLVFNAIKHTPARTRIRVSWERDDTGARLEVVDDGPGIAARHLPHLTERFYRIDPGRARETGGNGLGLSIVKHALELEGAELRIASRPGHGTTFECRFPAASLVEPTAAG